MKINYKKVEIITVIMLVSLTVFSFKIATSNDDIVQSFEVVATPVSNKTIVIDAGHGEPDGGAVSDNGISEEEINLSIALKLQKILESNGTTVILTRSDENSICDVNAKTIKQKKVSDLKNRVKIGNESSADAFVSIHLNKINENRYSGWQCFYKESNEKSKDLAKAIQNGLNDTIQTDNGRVIQKLNNTYLMKNIEIPITVVECGFLSNKLETENLQKSEYQDKLAWGIYIGLNKYMNE